MSNRSFRILSFCAIFIVVMSFISCGLNSKKPTTSPSAGVNTPILTTTPKPVEKPSESPTKAPEATVEVDNKDNISSDLSENPISIKVSNGTLKNASLEGDDSDRAILNKKSNTDWEYNGFLTPGNTYTLKVSTVNNDNIVKDDTFNITTFSVDNQTIRYTLFPFDGSEYGVGMPVTIQFSSPVTNKKEIEQHLHIKTDPETNGSWGWVDNTRVVWRPEGYWMTGTKIETTVDLEGVHLTNNTYGAYNLSGNFKIGRSLIMDISNDTKQMSVIENGNTVRTIPVSLGKPGNDTVNGTHIVYEKSPVVRMVGEDYDEDVYLDQRFTSSGFFIHSAPWDIAQQGKVNVSHGCVNVSPENAQWLYDETILGDVVKVSGTVRDPELWDGMGAIWNLSYDQWKTYSALNQ